jgi:hypothetical protein
LVLRGALKAVTCPRRGQTVRTWRNIELVEKQLGKLKP